MSMYITCMRSESCHEALAKLIYTTLTKLHITVTGVIYLTVRWPWPSHQSHRQ